MKVAAVLIIVLLILGIANADEPKTFDQAKALAAQSGKPIILEFVKSECEYCSQMAQDVINRKDLQSALDRVVHISMNFKGDEGSKIADQYTVGIYFPVFFLLNSQGEIIKRWTGYTTVERFVGELNAAMNDMRTVNDRLASYKANPTFNDALYFAKYYSDIWDYLTANDYYRQARNLRGAGPSLYAYEIFQNTANAAWQDTLEFDDVLPMADSVLTLQKSNSRNIVGLAKIMARLGRKKEMTHRLAKYLQAGIDITARGSAPKTVKEHELFRADYALYVEVDTSKAVQIKKATMTANWAQSPEEFYGYARWCLEHRIQLAEAESFVRKALGMASPGEFRGQVHNTLAEICHAQGNKQEAINQIKLAIEQNPKKGTYKDKLKEWQGTP
ncbi:MAG: thioredoxin family protein [candidate division Zixibacteria bacterium]|nr:thioredoxin family protein [candidate division Zixibacteria bacterium]